MASFNAFWSRKILKLPVLGFSTTTIELTQSVGSVTLAIMPSRSKRWSLLCNLSLSASGTRLAGLITGMASGLMCNCKHLEWFLRLKKGNCTLSAPIPCLKGHFWDNYPLRRSV